jgi:multiple sugar transport system substrate-binding protein
MQVQQNNRNTRRRFAATGSAMAVGGVGVLAAACGAGGNTDAGAGAGAAPKTVSGSVNWFMRASGAELQWEQAAVAAFKQAQPSVTVNLDTVAAAAEFDPKLTALQAGGTPPDVWTHWGQSGFGDYYVKGMLGELQSFVNRDKLDMGQFFANIHDAWKKDGKLFGLSFNSRFATFVYYNRQLFQQAGLQPPPADWEDRTWTWDKMVEASRKIADPSRNVWGFAAGAQPRTWGMAYLFGGDFFTKEHYEKGIARQSNIGSPEVQAAMQAEADLITKQRVWPLESEGAAIGITSSVYRTMFARGNLAMLYDTGSEWPTIDQTATVEWGVAAAPRQKSSRNINFINPLVLSKESKNREAAWSFIKWNVSEPGQRALVQFSFQPVLKSLLEEWLKASKTLKQPLADVRKAVEGAAPHTQIGPNQIMADFGPVRTEVDNALAPVWRGEKSVTDALRDAKAKVDAHLAESYARYGGK